MTPAPVVTGYPAQWRLQCRPSEPALGVIKNALAYAATPASIEAGYVDVFARIVMAAINEVAMVIALDQESAAVRAASESAFGDFLDRLLAGNPGS